MFWGLQHLRKSTQNKSKMDPQIIPKSLKLLPETSQKAMPKISIKVVTNKMHKNQILDPKCSKIASQNGVRPLIFGCLFWHCLQSCLWEAPGPPKIITKSSKKHDLSVNCSWTSAFVAAWVMFSRKNSQRSHCNYSRLELYLPSLGKVKMVTQYAQIAWAGCLGVRRWPAAGVFDI